MGGSQYQPMKTKSSDSCTDSAGERTGPTPYGGQVQGNGTVSLEVETVELLSDEQACRGTPAHPSVDAEWT